MQRVKLSEQLSLSRIIQGFWRLDSWNFSTEELVKFMHGCIDRGVTAFDTAEIYGDTLCEKLMGDAFEMDPGLRGQIELVSKMGIYKKKINGEDFGYYNTSYEQIIKSCHESLKRLHTDHIDLYLIHREDPLLDPWDSAKALKKLKAEGLVKEVGVSNFDPYKFDALNKAMDGELVTNQIEWNPVCFEHFNSGMMDYLTYHRIHPMIWSPLAGGSLFTSDEQSILSVRKKINEIAKRHNVEPSVIVYAWILYHPVGAMPLIGSSKLLRLDQAIKALDVKLEQHEWFEIYSASGQQQIR